VRTHVRYRKPALRGTAARGSFFDLHCAAAPPLRIRVTQGWRICCGRSSDVALPDVVPPACRRGFSPAPFLLTSPLIPTTIRHQQK
jgi:hypothetical protein